MKKRKYKLIISLSLTFIIILLLIITFTMWPFQSYKIIETKTFSEIPGFAFEYPIFKNWEVSQIKKINENEYYIFFKCPFETAVAPYMKIEKISNLSLTYLSDTKNHPPIGGIPTLNAKKNKNNILYDSLEDSTMPYTIQFYEKDFGVRIKPFIHEGDDYSGKLFVKTIINSFKLTICSPESIKAVSIKELIKKNISSIGYQDVLISQGAKAVIEKLKQDKENPDDFYATVKVFEKSGINGYLITFHLSHKDDFKPENCNKVGNPSGKSRDMVYDTNQQKITKSLLWQ